jgi:hypothetical protein
VTKVVKNLSVMRTDESDKHLKILMEAYKDQSKATREALKLAARILEYAWIAGYADRGTVPDMRVQYRRKESPDAGRPVPGS